MHLRMMQAGRQVGAQSPEAAFDLRPKTQIVEEIFTAWCRFSRGEAGFAKHTADSTCDDRCCLVMDNRGGHLFQNANFRARTIRGGAALNRAYHLGFEAIHRFVLCGAQIPAHLRAIRNRVGHARIAEKTRRFRAPCQRGRKMNAVYRLHRMGGGIQRVNA